MSIRYIALNLLNLFTAVVEGILGMRFVLRLFGANGTAGFVNWIYEMSNGLLDPFRAIFPTKVFENKYILEFSTLFAMLIYAIAALLLAALIDFVTRAASVAVSDEEIVERPAVRRRRR